ncbi:hypothetical protein WJX72_011253 [[Myrmecia] bisecta]|uniref:DEK-C domain-containing protein n=1 Tax=[Myrmecia] bisecta TaxID=41462 RepID=A0AAW1Q3Y1_9CHLO
MPRRPRAGQVSEASLASHDDATPAVQEEDAPDAEPAETHSDLVPLTYDELLEARQLAALLAPTWQQMRERDAQLVCRWPLEYRGIIRPTKKSKISEQAEYASRTRDTPRPGISVAALPSAEEAAAQGRRGNMQPAGFGGPVPMDWHLQAADGNSSESDSEADDAVDWRCIAFVPPPLDAAPEEAAIRHTCGSWNPPERRRCCACRAPRWEDELHSRVAAILQTSDLSTVTVRQVMQRLQHEGLRPNGRGLLFPKVAVRHAVERFVRRSVKRERHEGLQEVLRFGTFPFAFSGDLDHTGRMHGHLDEDELDRDIMTSFEELSRDDDDVPLPSVDPQKAAGPSGHQPGRSWAEKGTAADVASKFTLDLLDNGLRPRTADHFGLRGRVKPSRGQLYSEEVGARQGRKAAPKSKGSLAYLLGSRRC